MMADASFSSSSFCCSNNHSIMEDILDALRKSDGHTSTIRSLLGQALSHPEIYVGFVEWLPLVKGDPISWNTCRLFAFGTYKDYRNATDGFYLPLTEPQLIKLKALTVITIVQESNHTTTTNTGTTTTHSSRSRRRNNNSNSNNTSSSEEKKDYSTTMMMMMSQQQQQDQSSVVVPYSLLCKELEIADIHELEDILIDCCFYTNLMSGKLDQMHQCLHCTFTESRDVSFDDIPTLLRKLQALQSRGQDLSYQLQSAQEYHSTQQVEQVHFYQNVQDRIAKTNEKIKSANKETTHLLKLPSDQTTATTITKKNDPIIPLPTTNTNDDSMDVISKQRQSKRSRA